MVLAEQKEINSITIGNQILDIITSGMYDNPLMVIREYLQNSVDAIDLALECGIQKQNQGRIELSINGLERSITITDNGAGIPNQDVEHVLCDIGRSTKNGIETRGFRGIGRLGGIGYCDEVIFETRQKQFEKVAVVKWDGAELREEVEKNRNIIETIQKSTKIEFRQALEDDAPHFFRVKLLNIHRFHKDELMNVELVKRYLGQVAPVKYDCSKFSYTQEISEFLENIQGFNSYEVIVNGENVFRPYQDLIKYSKNRLDKISGVELFEFRNSAGETFGKGWYAKTKMLASIPKSVDMRGIRLRQGNIQIGDEYTISNIFSERRFATWHIGEIHLNYSIKANARRDNFEQSNYYELFLEQISKLGLHLTYLCRKYSQKRSGCISAQAAINDLSEMLNNKICIDEEHFRMKKEKAQILLTKINEYEEKGWLSTESLNKLSDLKLKIKHLNNNDEYFSKSLDRNSLRNFSKKQILEILAKEIINNIDKKQNIDKLLSKIFNSFLKPNLKEEYSE